MHGLDWILWGFVATVVFTLTAALFYGLGLTRMSWPYLIGLMYTPDRDRALFIGSIGHLLMGWVFSLFYIALFHSIHKATWWFGGIIGLVHGLYILTVVMFFLPAIHPRMAHEQQGPTVSKGLEAPGFLAMNYGVGTPLTVLASHFVFGAILGALYKVT